MWQCDNWCDNFITNQIHFVGSTCTPLSPPSLQKQGSIKPARSCIQATFQDAIFCCAKAKEYFPDEPLYLVKNDMDPEESFFGVVRAKYKNANLDSLEFIHGASAISLIDDIWSWTSSVDISYGITKKLKLNNVDICGMFRVGQLTISSLILEHGMAEIDFNSLSDLGYSHEAMENLSM